MIEILAYAIGIMYTPGPVNLIGLNVGLGGRTRASLGFFLGVGMAMFMLLLLFGWLGTRLVREEILIYTSLVGCLYMVYLAVKIAGDSGETLARTAPVRPLGVRSGFVIQLLNPKAMIATLPITSIQFPAAQIHGWSLLPWSLLLGLLAAGAPGSYSVAGNLVGRQLQDPRWFRCFNLLMATLLLYSALALAYQHVYLPLAR
ncbi:LysE family translocator [Aeromonas bivalvium]|uniref:LysE family translocator n=1 Tax=Aeromonas bivalvium TaxID=440079 RepID=UPI000DD0A369|nr:LysE family transporter [Aeromonas bivalvium]